MMESWTFDPTDETEPRANLNLPDGEMEINRGNARLYTHLGRIACYDHAFITRDEAQGFYVFNFVGGYDELKEFMLENDFPAYLNQTEVAQVDIDAYDRIIQRTANIPDEVPEEWLSE